MTKTCIKCGKTAEDNEFRKGRNQCKECQKLLRQAYEQTPEGIEARRRYRKSPKSIEYDKAYYASDKCKQHKKAYQHSEQGKDVRRRLASTPEARAKQKAWRSSEHGKARLRAYGEKTKATVVAHYSNETNCCKKCGFTDMRALSIDHINGGGCEHLRQIGEGRLYPWLIKNEFPDGFQVLCMNCNFIKRHENNECSRNE